MIDIKKIIALETLQDTVTRFNLAPKKSLGQNFLFDLNITQKIARIAGKLDSGTVIEVGPGPGGLTRGLFLSGAQNVIAIDTDPRTESALEPLIQATDRNLSLFIGDAKKVDISTLGESPRQIVANLPYNVGTLLLTKWLETPTQFSKMTLMFQKEVAQRITASVGDKHYGRLAILCNWSCHTQIEMYLSPSAFTPPPKVDSAVITLVPRPMPLYNCDAKSLSTITKSAFGQRRKMIRGSLKSLGVDVAELLTQANIVETKRAEELTIEEFCRLANIYNTIKT